MERHLEELLERAVAGIERLAQDPVMEIEGGPPICPFCNYINPAIHVQEQGGKGAMFEFVLVAVCTECGNTMYGVPMIWRLFTNQSEVQEEMAARKGGINGN